MCCRIISVKIHFWNLNSCILEITGKLFYWFSLRDVDLLESVRWYFSRYLSKEFWWFLIRVLERQMNERLKTQLYTLKQTFVVLTWSVKSYVGCLKFTECRYFRNDVFQKLLTAYSHTNSVPRSKWPNNQFANWFIWDNLVKESWSIRWNWPKILTWICTQSFCTRLCLNFLW